MTTPDTKMLSAERLREISIRCANETLHVPLRVLGVFEVVQLLDHISALTARVAELEVLHKEKLDWGYLQNERAIKAETELAAARAPVSEVTQ